MAKVKKNCGNCRYGCDAPLSMKPLYGLGGMMLVCAKPRVRKRKGIELVAPENKCRDWEENANSQALGNLEADKEDG